MTRSALFVSAISLLALTACGDNVESTDAGAMATAGAAGETAAADAGEASAARAWTVDPTLSTLAVTGEYGANPFTGTFNDWSADIVFSPDDLAGSSVRVEVQVASFESGDSSRDEAARSPRWLNAVEFPTAMWESTGIEQSGDTYLARGEFTVAGMTSPLDIGFTVDITGDTAHAIGSTSFDHHELGIDGGYDDADTGDVFTVNFDITARAE